MRETSVIVQDISHRYGSVQALSQVSFSLHQGESVALIGPDGVGKSTLLSLLSGIKKIQHGEILLFSQSLKKQKVRAALSSKIAFMPEGLGKNLYFSLSIYENLDFIARLFGVDKSIRQQKIEALLKSTGLYPYKERAVGKLSGGMKQKLALCCALIHDPQLLILDEPTTGVDPLSRRQFWLLINELKKFHPQMIMIVATAYMEEAAQFDRLIGFSEGRLLFNDKKDALLANGQSVEEIFVSYLHGDSGKKPQSLKIEPFVLENSETVIEACHLNKQFSGIRVVDDVSFSIHRGEIFGFLGSNGCGKTTTMKMLTGLLPPTSGEATLLNKPITKTDDNTKKKVGYVSQLFSLYEELSVIENLRLHARLYQMDAKTAEEKIAQSLEQFELSKVADSYPAALPLGVRQRLQLAAACLHDPEVLILDEPTSGVDPEARDGFWRYLIYLSRQNKITIFISTHFMNEAERCDRISLMDRGKVLAMGTPKEIISKIGADDLEEAFIAYLLQAYREKSVEDTLSIKPELYLAPARKEQNVKFSWFHLFFAFAFREWRELLRDRIRISFTFLGALILLVSTVFCISFDIENIRFSVLDEDQSIQSERLIDQFSGSRFFKQVSEIHSPNDLDQEIKRRDVDLIIGIPPHYQQALNNHLHPEINFFIDGSQPFRASNVLEYIAGIMLDFSQQLLKESGSLRTALPDILEPRFLYNPEFKTLYSIVPGMIMMSLILVTTMLTALGVVREKEKGSIINFYSSPASGLQYLLGKQAPYVILSFLSGFVLVVFSIWVLRVPCVGSLPALFLGIILYLFAVSALGLLISEFTNSEINALFLAAILTLIPASNFSGLIYPISTLEGWGYWLGRLFPASWFQNISVGVFNKGLGFRDLIPQYLALLAFTLSFLLLARLFLRKQEK